MEGNIQLIFSISIVTLTVIFVIVGVWLILALKELRGIMRNLNKMVGNFEEFTSKLNDAADLVSGVAGNFQQGLEVVSTIRKFLIGKKDGEEGE